NTIHRKKQRNVGNRRRARPPRLTLAVPRPLRCSSQSDSPSTVGRFDNVGQPLHIGTEAPPSFRSRYTFVTLGLRTAARWGSPIPPARTLETPARDPRPPGIFFVRSSYSGGIG